MPGHALVDGEGDEDRARDDVGMIAWTASDAGRDEGIAADEDLPALHMAHDAFALDIRDVSKNGQREATPVRGGDDGPRHRVLRCLLQ